MRRPTPGALGERSDSGRTSQQGCSATNRMACFRRAQPQSAKDGKQRPRGRPEALLLLQPTLAGPGSSGPQFPHLYNGRGWGPVIPVRGTVTGPEQ